MAVPKRRKSKARKNMRRANWKKVEAPDLVECPQCHELRLPHRACLKCGYYKGQEVIK
ncbi:MAG: 50S ribosomal protein L32 [Syntrophomonadaceae bacterium]|jgi:large subunit ribosomal protein L32|nr:50S ribosomal protein L32 [Syntrophomonadaceae bacterium]